MTEHVTETIEIDEAEIPNLEEALKAEKHTLLEIWQAILSNLEAAEAQGVTMQDAARILSAWPRLGVEDLTSYHSKYYAFLRDIREVLDAEIARDPKAFEHVEDDAEANRDHYVRLLQDWQLLISQWQYDWTPNADHAMVAMAAIADAGSFVARPNGGLLSQLDGINFQFTDEDSAELAQLLADHEGTEFNIGWREDVTEKDDVDIPGSAPGEFTSAQFQHLVNEEDK